MTKLAILASAVTGLFGAAMAQPVTDPTGVVPNLSFDQIDPVIRSFDESVGYVSNNGIRLMRIESRGRVVLLQENGCTRAGCAGLMIYAGFNESADLEIINKFSRETPSQRAMLDTNGNVVLMHYMIGDYGVTRGSLIVNIGAFFAGMDKWMKSYSSGNLSNTVSFDPIMAEDVAAETHISREILDMIWSDPSLYNEGLTNKPAGER